MDLLTVRETAAILKVNPETVRRHIAAGLLPAVRIGRRVRIQREALEALPVPIEGATNAARTQDGAKSGFVVPPLTEEQIRMRREAIAGLEDLQRRILMRRGGKLLPPS